MNDIYYAVNDTRKQAIELGEASWLLGVKAPKTAIEMQDFVLTGYFRRWMPPPPPSGKYLPDPIFNTSNMERLARALFALEIQRVTSTDYNPAQFEIGDYTLVASLHREDDRIGKTLYQRQETSLRRSPFVR